MPTNPADSGASTETTNETTAQPSAPPVPTADELAYLRAAAEELASLKAEAAAGRKADRDARKRAQEEAERAGELAKALETAKSRLAELEGLEPLANRWRAHEESESKRLDAEAATLPDAVRALYADASSVEAKSKVIAAFKAAPPAGAPKSVQVAPSIGTPPSVSSVDVEAALADPTGKKFAEIKARDPGAVAKFFASVLGKGGGSNSLGIARFAGGTKAPNA